MLVFPPAIRDEIVSHAQRGADEETCGVLAGEHSDERSRVEEAYPTDNAADAPQTRYRIDAEELLATIQRVEAADRDVVGFYHSHPNGPERPSATDAARATWSSYSYVICSLAGEPSVRSWRWTGNRFEREQIHPPD